MDLRQAATEAEADRLLGVFLRIRLLAQSRHIDFRQAGEEAVRSGQVAEEGWRFCCVVCGSDSGAHRGDGTNLCRCFASCWLTPITVP
jgi:hypothetical protein